MSRLTEMEAFATVVEEGGFSDAARKMGVAKSTISKHVSALEARLGTRLLSRSTRRVSPTEIGLAYYDRASRILNDAGEADALVATLHATPAGQLHVSATSDFGIHEISPRLGRFLAECPQISVNLALNNQQVDLISEGFDLAILMGDLNDSSLRARKLCDTRMRLIASHGYLNQFGRPAGIDELADHLLLHYSNRPDDRIWKLIDTDGACRQVRIPAGLCVNDGQSLVNAAIDGLGIAYLPEFLCRKALQEGQLVDVIPQLPPVLQSIHAVYPPGRFTQPKVRAFIDFLVREFTRPVEVHQKQARAENATIAQEMRYLAPSPGTEPNQEIYQMAATLQVIYPVRDGTTFDFDYYLNTHMPLVGQHMGPHIESTVVTRGLAGGPDTPSPVYAVATILFKDQKALGAAMQAAAPVVADIANFTNTKPDMVIGETIA